LKFDQATYSVPSGPTNGWENWFSLQGPFGVGSSKVLVQAGLAPDTSTRGPEALAVVGRGTRPDVGGSVGRELGPGDVHAVAERATAVVVDRQQLLVLERAAGRVHVGVLDHRPPREVPGRAGVAGGAVQVDGAGVVGHRSGRLAPG
jgi:hypothetical protein